MVAFSGTVEDGGKSYTESGMNSASIGKRISERQTAKEFGKPEYRFLIVANKFQTGFDQPLLHTMYVDKKLGGVNAVQTLSRLNRIHPEKTETMVLDFANDAETIRKSFEPYYETTLLSEATDPNLLYELEQRLEAFGVYTKQDVDAFARVYFARRASQDRVRATGGRLGAVRRAGRGGEEGISRATDGLRAPVRVPLSGPPVQGPGSGEALRLRPQPAAAHSPAA